MKILIAATALTLVTGAAFAGEGQGNPFPFNAPPISVSMQGYKQAPGSSQNPYPFTSATMVPNNDQLLPSAGQNGVLQTANSLPQGFQNGTSTLNTRAAPALARLTPPASSRVIPNG